MAIKQGRLELVDVLLSFGAAVDQCDEDGRNAVHLAIDLSSPVSILRLILKCKPRTDTVSKVTNSFPLRIVATKGDLIRAELLLIANANPNFKPKVPSAAAPLTFAVDYGHIEMVKLLLYYGADINHKEETGEGYMELAVNSVLGTPDLEPPSYVEGLLLLLSTNGCTMEAGDLEVLLNLYPPSILGCVIRAYQNGGQIELVEDAVRLCDDGGWFEHLKFLIQYYALRALQKGELDFFHLFPNLSKQAYTFYDDCVLELSLISLVSIGNVKLVEILKGVKFYVKPCNLVTFLRDNNLEVQFPIYSTTITRILDEYEFRNNVLTAVSNKMSQILGFHIEAVNRKICQYFSLFELEKLQFVLK